MIACLTSFHLSLRMVTSARTHCRTLSLHQPIDEGIPNVKRPTWVTTVGVLGIIFGCTGIFGAGQDVVMPKMMEMQRQMMSEVSRSAPQEDQHASASQTTANQNARPQFPNPQMFKSILEKMFDVPEWFGIWSISIGGVRCVVSVNRSPYRVHHELRKAMTTDGRFGRLRRTGNRHRQWSTRCLPYDYDASVRFWTSAHQRRSNCAGDMFPSDECLRS